MNDKDLRSVAEFAGIDYDGVKIKNGTIVDWELSPDKLCNKLLSDSGMAVILRALIEDGKRSVNPELWIMNMLTLIVRRILKGTDLNHAVLLAAIEYTRARTEV